MTQTTTRKTMQAAAFIALFRSSTFFRAGMEALNSRRYASFARLRRTIREPLRRREARYVERATCAPPNSFGGVSGSSPDCAIGFSSPEGAIGMYPLRGHPDARFINYDEPEIPGISEVFRLRRREASISPPNDIQGRPARPFARWARSRVKGNHISPGVAGPAPGRLFMVVAKFPAASHNYPGWRASFFFRIIGWAAEAPRRGSTQPKRHLAWESADPGGLRLGVSGSRTRRSGSFPARIRSGLGGRRLPNRRAGSPPKGSSYYFGSSEASVR